MRSRTNRHSGLVARNAGSVCRMEALEPRLLLANELIVGFGDVNFKNPQMPGDKIDIPVTFQNVSGALISGKVRIRVYASNDGVIDMGDSLVADKTVNINARPNEIQSKSVKGQFPLDTLPNEYQFIVLVDESESMLPAGVTFDVGEAVDDEGFILRWVFGTVDGRAGNTGLRFMNTDGVIYSLKFAKEGFGGEDRAEVFVDPPIQRGTQQNFVLDLTEVDSNDRITVRRIGGPTDPDLFYLNGIFPILRGNGGFDELGFFDAPDLTLYGPAEFSGGLHKLYLGNVLDAGQVVINQELSLSRTDADVRGSDEDDRISIKVRDVVGTVFAINQVLANMQALSFSGFIGGPPEPLSERGLGLGGIAANFIEKVNIQNDFEGFVFAGDLGKPRGMSEDPDRSVGAFIVGGTLTGGMVVFGDVAKIQAGDIGEFEAGIVGRLERLVVKGDVGAKTRASGDERGAEFGTIIGATDISRIDIDGFVFDAQIFAGLNFIPILRGGAGFGNVYFGSVDNASFTSGIIGRVNIGEDMIFSEIAAGVDPDGSDFFSDGVLEGDSSVSHIGPIKVGGVVGKARFVSGDFPDNVSIDGSTYSTVTNPDGFFVFVFPPV